MNYIEELEPGNIVEYILTGERGIVSSITDLYIFVKFTHSISAQACEKDSIKLI